MNKLCKRKFSKICLLIGGLTLVFGSCSEKTLKPDDVEYRRDENGAQILFELGADEPYGSERQAFVSDKHTNGKPHFKISFRKGKKDGPFTFWQNNELKLLTGFFKEGKRHGLFTAYGRTGELVYEKNYKNGELDGNFTLYYPASNSDVYRYSEKLKEDIENIIDKRLEELTPEHIKIIMKEMIQKHLGWLVVWGGVFGFSIGLLLGILGSLN